MSEFDLADPNNRSGLGQRQACGYLGRCDRERAEQLAERLRAKGMDPDAE